jgi:outer membrane protein OmpA-like peptidoglycan-associated protein
MASAYADARGGAPAAVVLFPGDGTLLNAEGRAQVRIAVEAFKRTGGNAYLRIVGHSSSRTSNMPLEKHLEIVFAKSQDRADAVAAEAIREGVPANRVLVEAVGDSQPVYYESMPKGEDGNRRAEIFVQS